MIISNKFNCEPVTLALWSKASRVERRNRNNEQEKPPTKPDKPEPTPNS